MRIVHRLEEVRCSAPSLVTIGVFDGVHRGHQQVVGGLAEAAHATGHSAVAISFDPHPASVLSDRPTLLLTTVGERISLLADMGLDVLVVLPFTEQVLRTPAASFVEDLMHNLCLAELWVGPDFALGHEQEGDVPYLQRLGAERGFQVRVIEPVVWRGKIVRSSRVRRALQRGDIEHANGCLGRPYRLSGVVVHGRGLAPDIGIPTATISPPPHRLIPASGVYACWAHTERWGTYAAATNVASRSNPQSLTVQAHLLDFDRDLYDQVLALDFVARLRDERAYTTPDAWVAQLRRDSAQTRALLSTESPRRIIASPGA